MIADVLPRRGLGRTGVVRAPCDQAILRLDDGTPFAVAFVNAEGGVTVAKVGDPEWPRVLEEVGEPTVICQDVAPQAFAGGQLLLRP